MSGWATLFSGGKDSSYTLHLAQERGLPIAWVVTVHPPADAFLYHVPGTHLAALAAESIGIPLVEVDASTAGADAPMGDATAHGDAELEPLEVALADLADDGLQGVTVGAVESEFQHRRVGAMADRLGIEVFDPLWQRDPLSLLREMVTTGFEIVVVAVAARGLDEDWLGRPIDAAAIAELSTLAERYGVHPMGEGGEFETVVTDGPHMDRPIDFEATSEWDGTRGHLVFEDAWLD